jgi:putative sterol carrier protein
MAIAVKELLEAMPAAFRPDRAGDAEALIQLDLTGEEAGQWTVEIGQGQCQVRQEQAQNPGVTVSMDAEDFVAMFKNEMDPIQAFLKQKVKISGNVGLVMQLLNWFDR